MTPSEAKEMGRTAGIHEYRIYVMEPSRMAGYLDLVNSQLLTLRQDRCGRLQGFWYGEFGALYQVHHLWEHDSLDVRQSQALELAAQSNWRQGFLEKAWPRILSQEVRFLKPSRAIEMPAGTSAFYEMRRYQAVVGKTASLEQQVGSRPQCPGAMRVGLWTGIAPDPNEVYELLAFRDLGSRQAPESRQVQQEWLESVAATLRGASSVMLVPIDISPLR